MGQVPQPPNAPVLATTVGRGRQSFSRRQLANLLTGLRLLLALPVALLILTQPEGWRAGAAVLFALAGLTDLLDGQVARRWGAVTALGSFLDPLADKAVVDGTIVALILRAGFPLPIAAILLGRDVLLTGMRLRGQAETLTPRRLAKSKTLLLYLGVGGLLLGVAPRSPLGLLAWGLIGIATLLSLLSLLDYVRRLHLRTEGWLGFAGYLVLPRPGPLLSVGKVGFFLLGSFIALSVSAGSRSFGHWLLVLVLYELVVSQGKYLFNDACTRTSDAYFLRRGHNRCPQGGRRLQLLMLYATVRAGVGVGALWLLAGWGAGLAGLLTVLLQLFYELVKASDLQGRGGWVYTLASANYGTRALAGMAAAGASLLSFASGLAFLWAAALGALFLSVYWQRQGAYYLGRQQLSPSLLARYKPGVLSLYRRGLHATRPGGTPPEATLLELLAIGAVPFFLIGPWRGSPWFAISGAAYLSVALLGLPTVRRRHPAGRWSYMLAAGVAAAVIAGTAAAGLSLRIPSLLPATLLASALFTYLIVSSPTLEPLMLHGATDGDPAVA